MDGIPKSNCPKVDNKEICKKDELTYWNYFKKYNHRLASAPKAAELSSVTGEIEQRHRAIAKDNTTMESDMDTTMTRIG